MRPDSSAARAAAIAGRGAGAAGWPTSMCTTLPPAASMRAAAAITSMTMNGGTPLRADGLMRRLAASSILGRVDGFDQDEAQCKSHEGPVVSGGLLTS